jgi:hypothetical protein
MKRNTLLLILTAGLIFLNAGCTSQESQEEQTPIENADVEKIDSPVDGDAIAAEPLGDAPAADDDKSLEASLDEPTVSTTVAESAPAPAPEGEVPPAPPTMDESSLNLGDAPAPAADVAAATEAPPAETPPPPAVEAPAAPAELTETPVTDTASAPMFETSPEPVAASPVSSKPSGGAIKKVASTVPYQAKDGGWVNTVYIARPKEKLVDISQKIFGADKTADLKKIAENSYLKSRAVRPGDKIYYVSPNRPDDSSKTMLYFEDMGMVPETYVARKGESLRKVAKELLGYDNAWKELWTSNSIESKTSLKDGETLRYWKATDAFAAQAPATLVDSSQAPIPTAQTAPPEPLPPPPADANAAMPPPPMDATAPPVDATAPPVDATAPPTDVAAAPPPPPPPADDASLAPPPPPVDDVAAAPVEDEARKPKVNLDEEAANEEGAGGLDTETLASMGALGVLVALLAFVIIRKKKQKSQMNNLEMNA